jgi:hypothetical protein
VLGATRDNPLAASLCATIDPIARPERVQPIKGGRASRSSPDQGAPRAQRRPDRHYEAARDAGIPRAKIDTLTAWWETDLHSEAEQAALRYPEALTRAPDTDADQAFQRFHDALAEHFDAEEILEIIGVVVNINVWTRLKLAEGRSWADLTSYEKGPFDE